MSSEIFWLYLLTRLDSLKWSFSVVIVAGIIALLCLAGYWATSTSYHGDVTEEAKSAEAMFKKVAKAVALFWVLNILVPGKDSIAFILAGTGVIEAAKTDTAQRLAGKSVTVVEQYLDELLKKEKKDGN